MSCVHKANNKDQIEMQTQIVKFHPYYNRCETVKNETVRNIFSNKWKRARASYFVASLSKPRSLEKRRHKVFEVQIRLIAKGLSGIDCSENTLWITLSKQKEILFSIVQRYIRVPRDAIEHIC